MVVTLTVLLLTVIADLVTAVGTGIIVSALISSSHLSRQQLAQFHLAVSDTDYTPITPEGRQILHWAQGRILVLHLSGPFSFCSAKEMVRRLSNVSADYRIVVLDLENVTMIDASVAMAFEEIIHQSQDAGRSVLFSCGGECAQSNVIQVLEGMKVLRLIPPNRRHQVRLHALQQAKKMLEEEDAAAKAV